MALATDETVVIGGGNVWLAPVGTAIPTDLDEPAAPWDNIGYIDEAGPAPSGFQRDKTSLYAWNSSNPLRTSYAPSEPAIDFTMLQVSEDTLALYFGGGTVAPGTPPAPAVYTAPINAAPAEHAVLIDFFDGTRAYRWGIPKASVAASGDISMTREQFMTFPVSASILATDAEAPFTITYGDAPAGTTLAARASSIPTSAAA